MTRPEGAIRWNDSHVGIWEEPGGRCSGEYEQGFLREVFGPIIRFLRDRGWKVGPDDHIVKNFPILRRSHRYCVKGKLEAKLEHCGRAIEFTLYQNVANVDHGAGGFYVYDKLKKMPYLLRKQAELEMEKLSAFLCQQYGYSLDRGRKPLGPGRNGLTAEAWIEQSWKRDRFPSDHRQMDEEIHSYNKESADGRMLKNHQRVYFADQRGCWRTGIAEHNINNMWWVIVSRYEVRNMASFELYSEKPADLRKPNQKICQKQRRYHLELELREAVARNEFERAAVLRDVLFRGQKLFRIRHRTKGWYGPQSKGYATDRVSAGQYTKEEAMFAVCEPNIFEVEAIDA